MLAAVVFDFDGTVADTETPEWESWRAEFEAHGAELAHQDWMRCVGAGPSAWDVLDHLVETAAVPVDRAAAVASRRRRYDGLAAALAPRPGVEPLLAEAGDLGIPTAVASSSSRDWVAGYLQRFGLAGAFHHVVCREDVARTKPDPELYLLAAGRLGVEPGRSLAIEDSPNGVAAARAAGFRVVAVPNPVTSGCDFSGAHAVLPSLAGASLDALASLAG